MNLFVGRGPIGDIVQERGWDEEILGELACRFIAENNPNQFYEWLEKQEEPPAGQMLVEKLYYLARGHEPKNGWGTASSINDAWADGFRTACVEISDAILNFPVH